jgi:hypothetical protein
MERAARRDLDECSLEEQRQRDALLQERDDGRLLLLPDRQQPLPSAMRVLVDHARVALDRRPVRPAPDCNRVGDGDGDSRVRADMLELSAEQRRRCHVDPLPVVERDQGVRDRPAIVADDRELGHEGCLEELLHRLRQDTHVDLLHAT